MTTITFERTGGVAGNDLHLDLDLGTLPEDEAQHLLKLIEEADFFRIPEHPASAVQISSDEFKYTITVDSEQATHTVHTSDSIMPNNLLPLAKELTMMKILHG